MKLVIMLAVLMLSVNSQAQVKVPRPLAAHEGGGAIGNGGELEEIDIIIVANKIQKFLASAQGRAHFKIDAAQFKSLVSKTLVQVVDRPIKDKNGALRTARNFVVEDQSVIQFSKPSLKQVTGQEAIFVLVFHEYLNLMGIEVTQRSEVYSAYPVSSKLISFVPKVAKLSLAASEEVAVTTYFECQLSAQVTEYEANWYGKWIKGETKTMDPAEMFMTTSGRAHYIRVNENGQPFDFGFSYHEGLKRVSSFSVITSGLNNNAFNVNVVLNGKTLDSFQVHTSFKKFKKTYKTPGVLLNHGLGLADEYKQDMDQISITCQPMQLFR